MRPDTTDATLVVTGDDQEEQMGRGGARPGGGRPPADGVAPKVSTTFRLSTVTLQQLRELAAVRGVKQVDIIEQAVDRMHRLYVPAQDDQEGP